MRVAAADMPTLPEDAATPRALPLAARNEQSHHQLLSAFEQIEATLADNAAETGRALPMLRADKARHRGERCGRLRGRLIRACQATRS